MSAAIAATPASAVEERGVTCQVCGKEVHSIPNHLNSEHPAISLDSYRTQYPSAPLFSEKALAVIKAREAEKQPATGAISASPAAAIPPAANDAQKTGGEPSQISLAKAFRITAGTKNGAGEEIMIKYYRTPNDPGAAALIPAEDKHYVFDVTLLKICLMGMKRRTPILLWGHAGTGKSTMFEQIASRTNRPLVRIQHNRFVEPYHIVGQTLANEKGTYFEPGPLANAMKYGYIFCADEYDTCQPGVLMMYQAVLEGKALIIPDAPAEWRRIEPHPDFTFVATGNTNGSGDESDLYAGTLIQNYANYTRFGIVEQVGWMPQSKEVELIMRKAKLRKDQAEKLVNFATLIRQEFENKKVSAPIGPRELLFCAVNGFDLMDWGAGICLAYANKLRPGCRAKVMELVQRCFYNDKAEA